MKIQNTITQKEVQRLFNYNKKTGILCWKVRHSGIKFGSIGHLRDDGYVSFRIKGRSYLAHRLIWLGISGYFPEHDIDHIDRNRSNNAWNNLREVSRQCNLRNTDNFWHNTSGIKGLYWDKFRSKWKAQIQVNGKSKYLGRFTDSTEAICHRLAAEQCLGWYGCDSNTPAYKEIVKYLDSYYG